MIPNWLFQYSSNAIDPRILNATKQKHLRKIDQFISDEVRQLGSDIYCFPLLTPEYCRFLCDISDSHGGWRREKGDDFSAPEIRLRRISPALEDIFSKIIQRHVNPLIKSFFMDSYRMGWMSPPFIIRYSPETQASMDLHYDGLSEMTISVPLSKEFDGGHLEFPRQSCSSASVEVGNAIVFPGGPSHLHRAMPITSGIRYSLTAWTRSESPN